MFHLRKRAKNVRKSTIDDDFKETKIDSRRRRTVVLNPVEIVAEEEEISSESDNEVHEWELQKIRQGGALKCAAAEVAFSQLVLGDALRTPFVQNIPQHAACIAKLKEFKQQRVLEYEKNKSSLQEQKYIHLFIQKDIK